MMWNGTNGYRPEPVGNKKLAPLPKTGTGVKQPKLSAANDMPFAWGQEVAIDNGDIQGRVIGYAIYPHDTEAKVAWFANGDHKVDWFAVWRLRAV